MSDLTTPASKNVCVSLGGKNEMIAKSCDLSKIVLNPQSFVLFLRSLQR